MPFPESEPRRIPAWAERERLSDLKWIAANFYVLFPAAQSAFAAMGRGAIVVDTTTVVMGEAGSGNPMFYLPEEQVQAWGNQDALRMVRRYDPTWQLVTGLLKPQGKESYYLLGIPTPK